MKKLLTSIFMFLIMIPLFGNSREKFESPRSVDARVSHAILDFLRSEGYTVLPEIVVSTYRNPQDTIKHTKSDYEKYWEQKEKEAGRGSEEFDNNYPKKHPMEVDDLYYTPSKDKNKPMTIFDRMKEPKQPKPEGYVEGYNEGYNDGYTNYVEDPFFYTNMIWRFNYGFSFYYGYPYYSYGYPWYYDSFYFGYGWGYPYYGWGYPYYGYGYGGGYPYYGHGHQANYGVGVLGSRGYGYNDHYSNIRRQSMSTMSKTMPMNNQKSFSQPQDRRMSTNPQNKSTYRPSYEKPRMSERPMYNNSHIQGNRSIGSSNNMNKQSMDQRRTQMQQNMKSGSMQNMENRRPQMNNQPATNRNYVQPSNNYNSGSRGSSGSGFSNSFGGSHSSGGSGGVKSSGGRK